jgi:hypothetical protein
MAVGKTDRMDNREGARGPAAWVRQPESTAVLVAVVGLNLLVASLFVPIGLANIALSVIGAGCIVIGTLTLLLHLAGRLVGLHRRADRVVSQGRSEILLPGVRPPQMYLRSRRPTPIPEPLVASGESTAVIDITDQSTAGRAVVPQPAPAPSPRTERTLA